MKRKVLLTVAAALSPALAAAQAREAWAAFRRLPLTGRELRRIARNVAPYLR
jgi:hypothetical protein